MAQRRFQEGFEVAFANMRAMARPDVPLTVFYAFKQAEVEAGDAALASTGWETMLEGLMRAGLAITGTWPMRTELGNRLRSQASNALASSVILVCRPRAADAPVATRKEFLGALRAELPDALRKLQQGNVAPVDLAQAAIGPGMAVFSRYSRVLEASGEPMRVRSALAQITHQLAEILDEMDEELDEPTRFALAWFAQHGLVEGKSGDADVMARGKNTSPDALRAAGIAEYGAGKFRLKDRTEFDEAWAPSLQKRVIIWEAFQRLIRAYVEDGETGAADVLRRIPGLAETARGLADRLFQICTAKGWAQEALAYNSLGLALPEITSLSHEPPSLEENRLL